MITWCLALALAFAQDAPPAEPQPPPAEPETPAPDPDDVESSMDDGTYTVIVRDEAIRAARRAVIDDMERQGWRAVRSNKGEVVFRGPANWMGAALLDAEGNMKFTTPAAAFQEVTVDDGSLGRDSPSGTPLAQESPGGDYQAVARDPGEEIVPQVSFALFPKKKADAVHDRVLAEVGAELASLRDLLQAASFQEQMQDFSQRLDATWELGVPLEEGQPRIATIEERRRAVLDFWASRSDSAEGEATCRAIEVWLAQVVQTSTDPVTSEEQEQANARAQHSRRLALVRP